MKLYFAIFFSAFAAASAQQVGNEVRDTQVRTRLGRCVENGVIFALVSIALIISCC